MPIQHLLGDLYRYCIKVRVARRVKLLQDDVEKRGWSLSPEEVHRLLDCDKIVLVDLRDAGERSRDGAISCAVHVPFPQLEPNIAPNGMLHDLAVASGKTLIFYCAIGGRSACAVTAAQDAGLQNSFHMKGGTEAWVSWPRTLDPVLGDLTKWAA